MTRPLQVCLAILILLLSFTSLAAAPPEGQQAFALSIERADPNHVRIHWNIQTGFYLYQNKIKLQKAAKAGYQLGAFNLPVPIKKMNKLGQLESLYQGNIELLVPVLGNQTGRFQLDLHYQGCAADGFCYPPFQKTIDLFFDKQLALVEASLAEAEPQAELEEDPYQTVLDERSLLPLILSFLGFGLLLSFTPCVLPMLPVLSRIIVGQGVTVSTGKAFRLSLSYVLSMASSYALVGMMIALVGQNLQTWLQRPTVITAVSLLFVFLALSMFNYFELRLPLSWQNALAKISRRSSRAEYLNAALLGSLSTLVLSPCVTPPLIGVLAYIAETGNSLIGALALFALGLGMGLPLLLLGSSAGKWLPKAGPWMDEVRAFFGLIMLGMAVFTASRILPATLNMLLWAALCVGSGIFLGALSTAEGRLAKCNQALGLLLLVYGLLILLGASQGKTNPLQPLAFQENSSYPKPKVVKSLAAAEKAIQAAKGQAILLDFYADWCSSCKLIASYTLGDPEIQAALKNIHFIKIDLSKNPKEAAKILSYFKVIAPPTFVFLNPEGKEIKALRLVGEQDNAIFLQHVELGASKP